jgi:hypothetical protein
MKLFKIYKCRGCPFMGTVLPKTAEDIFLETIAYCQKMNKIITPWAYEEDFPGIPQWCPLPDSSLTETEGIFD